MGEILHTSSEQGYSPGRNVLRRLHPDGHSSGQVTAVDVARLNGIDVTVIGKHTQESNPLGFRGIAEIVLELVKEGNTSSVKYYRGFDVSELGQANNNNKVRGKLTPIEDRQTESSTEGVQAPTLSERVVDPITFVTPRSSREIIEEEDFDSRIKRGSEGTGEILRKYRNL